MTDMLYPESKEASMGDLEHHVDRMIRHWLIREENLKRLSRTARSETEVNKVKCQVLLKKIEPVPFIRRRWNG